jgi:hypothetical protein
MFGAVSRGDRGDVAVGISVDVDAKRGESLAKIDDARTPRRIDDDVAEVSGLALELGSRLCGEFCATCASFRLGSALFEKNARFALALFFQRALCFELDAFSLEFALTAALKSLELEERFRLHLRSSV